MANAADKKRWAILPPPPLTASESTGEFTLKEPDRRRRPARRTVSGEIRKHHGDGASGQHSVSGQYSASGQHNGGEPVDSSVQELEPSDSERVTEVPPTEGPLDSSSIFGDSCLETIPAPPLSDDEE